MKGSIYRKRYILVYADMDQRRISALDKNLFRIFRCRKKYSEQKYLIFLTNQFLREQVVEYINENFRPAMVLTVSGTIKKCKKKIQEHKASKEEYEEINLGRPN